jgi:hypothetical protein
MTTRINNNTDDEENATHQLDSLSTFTMRKTFSVDFTRLRRPAPLHSRTGDKHMASQFSLRAARGSFSSG